MIVRDKSDIDLETNTSGSGDADTSAPRNEKAKGKVDRGNRVQSQVNKNMLIVVVCFFVCNLPMTFTLVPGIKVSSTLQWYLYAIFTLRCLLNPLIYAWKHPVYRQVFGCMLSRDLRAIEQPSRWLRKRMTDR